MSGIVALFANHFELGNRFEIFHAAGRALDGKQLLERQAAPTTMNSTRESCNA